MHRLRRRNFDTPGQAHELTFSCYRGYRFFEAERTCEWLASAIDKARRQYEFDVWAYVFMPEHVHLLIHPKESSYHISTIRASIKAPVGRKAIAYLESHAPEWLARVTRKRGTKVERLFWQSGGGYDRNVESGRTMLRMIDYIHANPVRRSLVERPRDWKWSSAAWYDDQTEVPLAVDAIDPGWFG